MEFMSNGSMDQYLLVSFRVSYPRYCIPPKRTPGNKESADPPPFFMVIFTAFFFVMKEILLFRCRKTTEN